MNCVLQRVLQCVLQCVLQHNMLPELPETLTSLTYVTELRFVCVCLYHLQRVCMCVCVCMIDSTQIATPPKSTQSKHSNSSVQIQINPKSQVEFAPRDTENSEFLDVGDFGGIAISVEPIVCTCVCVCVCII